ncbi:MAG: hypothetical protein ACT4PO_13485 [Actinomycetota bacterium]
MRASRRPAALAAVLAALLALGSSCSPDEPSPPVVERVRLPLDGRVIVGLGQQYNELAVYFPASGEVQRFPGARFGRFEFVQGAVWVSEDTAYAMVETEGFFASRLHKLSLDRKAEPIGPPLRGGRLLGLSGDVVIAVSYRGIWTMDLRNPRAWRLLAKGFTGALSPDGRSVAYVPKDAGSVWRVPVDGSDVPTRVVDARDLELRDLGLSSPRFYEVAWGKPGIAITAATGPSYLDPGALVFVPSAGPVAVIALGDALANDPTWQPNGALLAFTTCADCLGGFTRGHAQGDLRLFDAGTGELRQVAAAPEFFLGVAWSPDGDFVVTRPKVGQIIFVDARTGATEARALDARPKDWGG